MGLREGVRCLRGVLEAGLSTAVWVWRRGVRLEGGEGAVVKGGVVVEELAWWVVGGGVRVGVWLDARVRGGVRVDARVRGGVQVGVRMEARLRGVVAWVGGEG